MYVQGGEPTWAGLYAERRDTCTLAALSLDVAGRRQPRIWGAAGLPSDSHALAAAPGSGALVLAHNLLLYHTQVHLPLRLRLAAPVSRAGVVLSSCRAFGLHADII